MQIITKKAMIEFEQLEKDEKDNKKQAYEKSQEIKSQQGFICFATICCFTESIVSSEDSIAEHFASFICMMKWKSVFM